MTQSQALDILKMGHSVYLTGGAGSGKTHVLNQFIAYLREHEIEVGITASTGIAATHMGGVTIHSWCGMGIKNYLSDIEIDALQEKQYLWNRFKATNVLIIDEISMLAAQSLDLVDQVCKAFKRNDEPFGGMQVVLCGDFFQLPPIVKYVGEEHGEDDQVPFAYRSQVWKDLNPKICYLTTQYRQDDPEFIDILGQIRSRSVTDQARDILRSRREATLDGDIRPTKLYTHNIDVDSINHGELTKIAGATKTYTMSAMGNPFLIESLKKSCLALQTLTLKQGAQVMFIKNNLEAGYVNGTLGVVTSFDAAGIPAVRTLNGKLIHVTSEEWSIVEEGKTKAKITQLPLRLAWAITVHKSQGMSLDTAEIDLSKSFVAGQGYVALSRVRSLAGLSLAGFNDMALEVDEDVFSFDEVLQGASDTTAQELERTPREQVQSIQREYVRRMAGTATLKKPKISTYDETLNLIRRGKTLEEIAREREITQGTVLSHIESLVDSYTLTARDLKHMKPSKKDFDTVKKACLLVQSQSPDKTIALTPVKKILGDAYTFEEIRLVRALMQV